MITAIWVSNFRCFRQTEVGPFKRINVISGPNGVGKTTLLEALWLYQGRRNPSLIWNPIIRRQLPPIQPDPLSTLSSETGPITLIGKESDGISRKVTFEAIKGGQVLLPLGGQLEQGEAPAGATSGEAADLPGMKEGEVSVTYEEGSAKPVRMESGRVFDGGVVRISLRNQMPDGKLPVAIILTSERKAGGKDTIERFSQIVREGRKRELVESLLIVEPRLTDMEITTEDFRGGTRPGLWCHLGEGRLLPAELMGDGLGRLLSLFAAMYQARGGLIMVDEVENGIHHSIMKQVWEKIAAMAEKFDVQVFASTHSRECVQAAYEALHEKDDFVLHRLHRKGDSIHTEPYEGAKLEAAFEMGFEVR
ncbi:MAG: AAA family ATPase [Chloroflexi bacterium]|nr:AAA family ATPase [Chloroflexota bacterium]